MKKATCASDYAPDTRINLIQTDDGDICINIHGNGEFRIATDGGHLHGEKLVKIVTKFSEIIDLLNSNESEV